MALTDEQIERLIQLADDYPSFKSELADLRTRLEQGDDRKALKAELDELKSRLNAAIKERTDAEPKPAAVGAGDRKAAVRGRSGFAAVMPWNVFRSEDGDSAEE